MVHKQMMRILVTGGAGFVGSNLACNLARALPGTEIVVLDNLRRRGSELNLPRLADHGVRFVHGDIRNPEDLIGLPAADWLVECSADPSVTAGYGTGPVGVVNSNLIGTLNCLEYARKHQSRVLFMSTSRVYPIDALNFLNWEEGETRFSLAGEQSMPGVSDRGISECFTLTGARSFYGMTKLSSEMMLEEYAYGYGLEYVVNRCGLIAGPWQMGKADQGIIAYWVFKHLFGGALAYIGFGGEGKQVRDFLHIDDLSSLVIEQLTCFDVFRNRTFNVGGGPERSFSLRELTEVCRELTGCAIDVAAQAETRTADVRIYISDCSELFGVTSWRPRRELRNTVASIVEWAQANQNSLHDIT